MFRNKKKRKKKMPLTMLVLIPVSHFLNFLRNNSIFDNHDKLEYYNDTLASFSTSLILN